VPVNTVPARSGIFVAYFVLWRTLRSCSDQDFQVPQVRSGGTEVGHLSYSNRHADLLLELTNRRYEKKSSMQRLREYAGRDTRPLSDAVRY
jgi:hypothetical protein